LSIDVLPTTFLGRAPHGSVSTVGTLKNYNIIEEFKAADKTALFNLEAQAVRVYAIHLSIELNPL